MKNLKKSFTTILLAVFALTFFMSFASVCFAQDGPDLYPTEEGPGGVVGSGKNGTNDVIDVGGKPNLPPASATNSITVFVNGKKVIFPDQKPVMKNNRMLVPIRFVAENLGASVSFKNNIVYIVKNAIEITLPLNSTKAYVNGAAKTFDTKAIVISSRTMVPLRFISETLKASVDWDNLTRSVNIKTAGE